MTAEAISDALNTERRREVISIVAKTAPVDLLAELLATQKETALNQVLESDRSVLIKKLVTSAPEEMAHVLAQKEPALEVEQALRARPSQAMAAIGRMPPEDLFKALQSSVPAGKLAELTKLLQSIRPQFGLA